MRLSDAVRQIYKRKWSYVNNFDVLLTWTSTDNSSNPAMRVGLSTGQDLMLNLMDFTTPQVGSEMLDIYQADKWCVTPSRLSKMTFSMKFRDQDQMLLWRKFTSMVYIQRNLYFDQAKFDATIIKQPDYLGEKPKVIMVLKECLIEAVSQLSLSNATEAQIAEFEVQCQCLNVVTSYK